MLLLAGFLVALKIFRTTNSSPEAAIKKAFAGSRYQSMVPLIIAQAKHETGGFTSNIFDQAKNMFGMKVPSSRPSQRSGIFVSRDGERYSKFASVLDSAKDQRLYFEAVNFPVVNDPLTFANNLKSRGYFQDSVTNYYNGLIKNL